MRSATLHRAWTVLWLALWFLCSWSFAAPDSSDAESHKREVESWREERHGRLSQPDGWFSLVGLAWLEEGENTCGSDPASAIRFPGPAPARLGTLVKSGATVVFEPSSGIEVSIDGKAQGRTTSLVTDAEGEPSLLKWDSMQFYLIDRGGRIGVRIKDSASPALAAFTGIDNYPIDGRWRTEAQFVPYDPPKPITVPNVLGTRSEQPSPGAIELRMAGRTHRLDVLPGGDGEYFVVFGDATNTKETYGGGRFLYVAEADEEGRVVVDFNKAYNPPCVFTPYATCPLPPRQNRLELAVHAGEKMYAGGVAH